MSEKFFNLLSLEIESETVFVDTRHVDEVCEISYVKSLPLQKNKIKGLTLINNNILPVISYSDELKMPVKGIVVKKVSPLFFIAVDGIGSIVEKEIGELRKTDWEFIYESSDIKILDVDEVERHIA